MRAQNSIDYRNKGCGKKTVCYVVKVGVCALLGFWKLQQNV